MSEAVRDSWRIGTVQEGLMPIAEGLSQRLQRAHPSDSRISGHE